MTGVVTRVVMARGFAFVRGLDDNLSRFFHAKEVVPTHAFDTMHEGMTVEFTSVKTDKGLRAVDVRVVRAHA